MDQTLSRLMVLAVRSTADLPHPTFGAPGLMAPSREQRGWTRTVGEGKSGQGDPP
jgi:hypothetical protein